MDESVKIESVENTLESAFKDYDDDMSAVAAGDEQEDTSSKDEAAEVAEQDQDSELELQEADGELEADDDSKDQDNDEEQDQDQDDDKLAAPQNWSSRDKEVFGKQPREVQEWLLEKNRQFQTDYQAKTKEIAPLREIGKNFETLASQDASYAHEYGDAAGYIKAVANTELILRHGTPQQKAQAVQEIIHKYNIPVGTQAGDAEQYPQADQHVQALKLEVEQLKRQSYQSEAARQQAGISQAAQTIESFAHEKDEYGRLKRPYFPEVESDMAALAQVWKSQGRQIDLNQLYESAVYSRPDLRESVLKSQNSKALRKKASDAERAKKAGSSISGKGTAKPDEPVIPRTPEDAVAQAFKDFGL